MGRLRGRLLHVFAVRGLKAFLACPLTSGCVLAVIAQIIRDMGKAEGDLLFI